MEINNDYIGVITTNEYPIRTRSPNSFSRTSSCSSQDALESSLQSAIYYTDLTRKDIENIINMKPCDIIKYKKAFVHKSVVKTAQLNPQYPEYMHESYERYEFLGDSILNTVIAKYLFVNYPKEQEGILTKKRTKLVNGKTLAFLAEKLNLNQFLILNTKVENINGRSNPRILEDVFEALICSINLDLGYNYAEKFILDTFKKYINFDEKFIDDNYKDILLRFCQNKFGTTPIYDILETSGPPHNRTFKIMCKINDISYKYGKGKSKKIAEQNAAEQTLQYFKVI